ncbi:MAG TPA: hypothetical protein VH479_16945 [Acidimicrobiales bacterium]
MTIKFINNTGGVITVPTEGHRVRNRGSVEGWNDLQLGESVNDLAPGAEHSTRQTLTILCVADADFEIHWTSTAGGEFTQLFSGRNIEDKQAVLPLTKN